MQWVGVFPFIEVLCLFCKYFVLNLLIDDKYMIYIERWVAFDKFFHFHCGRLLAYNFFAPFAFISYKKKEYYSFASAGRS